MRAPGVVRVTQSYKTAANGAHYQLLVTTFEMRLISTLAASLICLSVASARGMPGSIQEGMEESVKIQREGLERLRSFLGPDSPSNSPPVKREVAASTISFSNPAAKKFEVDGSNIPLGEH